MIQLPRLSGRELVKVLVKVGFELKLYSQELQAITLTLDDLFKSH